MWPKTIYVKGIGIQVESWEEFEEIVQRYGSEQLSSGEAETPSTSRRPTGRGSSNLTERDQVLLKQFIDEGKEGVLNGNIGPLLGAERKGISPALKGWARRIGLVEGNKMAFEPFNSNRGRGYRIVEGYVLMAKQLLGI